MVSLNNGILRLDIDDSARVTHLENLVCGAGNVISEPKPLYRLNLHTGANFENVAFAEDQSPRVTAMGGEAVIELDAVNARMGKSDICVKMNVRLDGDFARFTAKIDNRSDSTVSDFYFPCAGAIRSLGGGAPMDLLWPRQLGEKLCDIDNMLREMNGREALHEITGTYPGHLSMGWTMLTSGGACLYYACHDPLLYVSTLRAAGAKTGGVTLEMDKMCFVKPGETWEAPEYVLRLYNGSWREGADEYAAWAKTWRTPIPAQDWMKRMNGYFLVINKQQYGDEIWPYETLPELYERARAHGFDCLGLFGWYHTGHDNNYPDLEVSPTMGGREGLEKGIRAVHEAGGRVTLYYQGHLMDVNSDFYKTTGWKLEGRTRYNNPYYEFYPKACSSDFARNFSRRVFSTVCPSCPEWHELMAKRIDWVASFGADGALYDQIGGMPPYPCFNEAHPHALNKPTLSYTRGRLSLLARIREQVKNHENFAFMSEHITDAYSQFLDCMHGIGAYPSRREGGMAAGPGMRNAAGASGARMMPQLFRYAFPDSMVTVRNPHPYIDQRLANYAFAFGIKFEMELRYLTDQKDIRADAEPEMRAYAKKVADLRREFEDYLLLGTFRADEGLEICDEAQIAGAFVAPDGRRAVAVWNDAAEARKLAVSMPGYRMTRYATTQARGEGAPETLEANGIAIIEVEKI